MTRKQINNAKRKHYMGLNKKLLAADFSEWTAILETSKEQLAILYGEKS